MSLKRLTCLTQENNYRLISALGIRIYLKLTSQIPLLACFSEFSKNAAIDCFQYLPEYFYFSGGIDTAAALITEPNMLFRKNGYSPLLWIGAFDAGKHDALYHFEGYGYDLTFNRKVHHDQCAESWLFGITVINK